MLMQLMRTSSKALVPSASSTAHIVAPYSLWSFQRKNTRPMASQTSQQGEGKAPEQQQTQLQAQQPQKSGAVQRQTPAALDMVGLPAPFRRLSDYVTEMQREMDQMMSAFGMPTDPFDMFERALGPAAPMMGMDRFAASPAAALLAANVRSLAVDVEEDDKAYTVHAEVPGFEKDEIKVLLSPEGVLTISGEKRFETKFGEGETKEGEAKEAVGTGQPTGYSRRYASFRRSLLLPGDVDEEGIKATTKNGVLTVTVPKVPQPAAPKPKEIPIA